MWRHISGSVVGASHAKTGAPCQDSHGVVVLGDGNAATLVACVADGAGSAAHSDQGSKIACGVVLERAAHHFGSRGSLDGLGRGDLLAWCEDARERITALAASEGRPTREYATTLAAAVVTPRAAAFVQIGDGAIIVGGPGGRGVVFWPQSGEYANTTNFLTGDAYEKQLEFWSGETRLTDVALMTDGIERIALAFDLRTPHAPFFTPLFGTLRAAPDTEVLNRELHRFLDSESVQHRSDDDKTVILAVQAAV